ncbi:MAG: hypothetical protein JSV79_09925 [Armatimonadota bacterium]|nr:MAG: hypothetical protein JSV79_09925 [Armatimonadota bacterium]
MREQATSPASWRRRRRVLLFVLAAAAWTLLSCYPNPWVLVQNLARYRRLPIDPRIEGKMGWQLLPDPGQIELFVDSLLVPTADWPLYRVPWYVPTAAEAARASHGDCEAKAVLLASLLAGKELPYEIRASFSHIWVDYPGRRARPGEAKNLAYLQGEPGRLRARWPAEVPWREVLAVQREQLWEAMPLGRKALWLLGLLWVGLGAALLAPAPAHGELTSRWRPRAIDYLRRCFWLAWLVFFLTALAANLWPDAGRARWKVVDLREVLAVSAVGGALVAWLTALRRRRGVTAEQGGSRLALCSSLGWRKRSRTLETASIAHLELRASAGGLRPWTIAAVLRNGERVALLDYGCEVEARAALRNLGRGLGRPLVVRADGSETWTMADEIGLALRERAARRPPSPAPERPGGCALEVEESDGTWTIRLPAPGRRPSIGLLAFAVAPVVLVALATLGVLRFPGSFIVWAGWIAAIALVSLVTYVAIMLRVELIAYLARVRLEIGEGVLRYHTSEKKVEAVALEQIETIELARQGEVLSLAVVSPERVLHIRGLGAAEHREWVRKAIEYAIANAS